MLIVLFFLEDKGFKRLVRRRLADEGSIIFIAETLSALKINSISMWTNDGARSKQPSSSVTAIFADVLVKATSASRVASGRVKYLFGVDI